MARNALGLEFGSAAQLSKRPGSVWNCLWGNALKRSPGIIRKSRVSYPGPGFLSSATWPSLPKKHYNGLYLIIQFFVKQALHITVFLSTEGRIVCGTVEEDTHYKTLLGYIKRTGYCILFPDIYL